MKKNNNNLPPKILQFIKDTEKTKINNAISKYESTLLKIENIGYLICSTLYDKYMSMPRIEDGDTRIFRYVLRETIKRFDSDIDIVENFKFFHSKFPDTFKMLSAKLNTCYLERAPKMPYLLLVKTKSGVKSVLNLDGDDMIYLKNIINSYNNDSELDKSSEKIKQNLSTDNDQVAKYNEEIKIINTQILDIETENQKYINRIKEINDKIETYNRKLKGTLDEYIAITEEEKPTKFDRSDLSHYEFMIKSNNEHIASREKSREHIQNTKSSQIITLPKNNDYLKEFIITSEDAEDYKEKIIKCIHNKKNILVPIALLDITKTDVINNIQQHILTKDNLNMKIKYHANMLFINTEKKYIEHFEPHGVSGLYDSTVIADALQNIHLDIPELKQYKFYKQAESCPIIYGPQALDRSYYCYIHSGYYSLLRILYPDISSEEVQTMLVSQINEGYKGNDRQDTSSLDYLTKKYTDISGEKIKTRLENFMKWHRYIVDFMNSPNKQIVDQFSNIIKDMIPNLKFD
jgi:hypothetical protein